MTAEEVRVWVEEHVGDQYIYHPMCGTVEVVEDPEVGGTFAVRFSELMARADRIVDLLFITGGTEGSVDEVLNECLEEVEFTCWPPSSGPLRFMP